MLIIDKHTSMPSYLHTCIRTCLRKRLPVCLSKLLLCLSINAFKTYECPFKATIKCKVIGPILPKTTTIEIDTNNLIPVITMAYDMLATFITFRPITISKFCNGASVVILLPITAKEPKRKV